MRAAYAVPHVLVATSKKKKKQKQKTGETNFNGTFYILLYMQHHFDM